MDRRELLEIAASNAEFARLWAIYELLEDEDRAELNELAESLKAEKLKKENENDRGKSSRH
jgi:hypothetical protein